MINMPKYKLYMKWVGNLGRRWYNFSQAYKEDVFSVEPVLGDENIF